MQESQNVPTLTFSQARLEDADAIFALYRRAMLAGRQNGSSNWDEDYPTREFLAEDLALERLFVLRAGETLVAAVSLLETDDLDAEPLGWRDLRSSVPVRLCVAPEQQGRHIGELVMRHLMDYAKEQGYESMRLLAAVENLAANRLYTRMGFSCLGAVALYGEALRAYEKVL
ncbi:MAG: GNAT family N-acetyltransferase [Anaerolineae bacterium]|jgi:ribosomal protein S18 acetylase RimI-like enzyme|nr:GNAT family N-acetyltransferase [Anaerolineae bacterium]